MNNIGFLREPERVNVMLSRAKHGEIIFGNKETLMNARGTDTPLKGGNLWCKIFEHLDKEKCIVNGLPVMCQHHRQRQIVSTPDEFERKCPNGGCNSVCGKSLPCGHKCKDKCHLNACRLNVCKEMVTVKCKRGLHDSVKQCCAKEAGASGVFRYSMQ